VHFFFDAAGSLFWQREFGDTFAKAVEFRGLVILREP